MALSPIVLIIMISFLGGLLYLSGIMGYALKDSANKTISLSARMIPSMVLLGLLVFVGLLISKFV